EPHSSLAPIPTARHAPDPWRATTRSTADSSRLGESQATLRPLPRSGARLVDLFLADEMPPPRPPCRRACPRACLPRPALPLATNQWGYSSEFRAAAEWRRLAPLP